MLNFSLRKAVHRSPPLNVYKGDFDEDSPKTERLALFRSRSVPVTPSPPTMKEKETSSIVLSPSVDNLLTCQQEFEIDFDSSSSE